MKRLIAPFVVGTVAVTLFAIPVVLCLSVLADVAGWNSFSLGGGPLLLLDFERTGDSVGSTFGVGLLVLAVVGGLLNAFLGSLLVRRDRLALAAVDREAIDV